MIELLSSIFQKIDLDPISLVDLLKKIDRERIDPGDFKKDGQEQFDLLHDQIDLSITKNDRFDKKNQMIEFTTLIIVPVGRIGSAIFRSFDIFDL